MSRYNGPAGGDDVATSAATSNAANLVVVTGTSQGKTALGHLDYATVAYNTGTGAQLWVSRYNGPGDGNDIATAVAFNPSGAAVYVTGGSAGSGTGDDYATVAYDAATGKQLWASRYDGPGKGNDEASSVAVSPNGQTVFVTGGSLGATSNNDYATVAYDAATGAQLWVSRYNGPGNGKDFATAIGISPNGSRLFVTGGSTHNGKDTGFDYATIAYNAVTGGRLWLSRYNGQANQKDYAHGLAVEQDGKRVFVTGASRGGRSGVDYATLAYSAATGRRLWLSRYNGPASNTDDALSVSSIAGGRVYVTGYSRGRTSGQDYATIAYNAGTGRRVWLSRYNGPANKNDLAQSVATGPGRLAVYVTGFSTSATSYDYATVAYAARTGHQLWARRYNSGGDDLARFVTVGLGGTVFVTGASNSDYGTVAYRG